MGKRGTRPTPTKVLHLRGSWRAGTRGAEAPAASEVPVCPAWVSPKGRKHWAEIAEMLVGIGIIADTDRLALAMLVDMLAQYLDAKAAMKTDGVFGKTQRGAHAQSAASLLTDKCWDRLLKICREFGMTPASRVGLPVREGQTEEEAKRMEFVAK